MWTRQPNLHNSDFLKVTNITGIKVIDNIIRKYNPIDFINFDLQGLSLKKSKFKDYDFTGSNL